MTRLVGVILVALIGNAAEHSSASLMSARNKAEAAITQVALFVAPAPLDLRFTTLEVVAVDSGRPSTRSRRPRIERRPRITCISD